MDDIARDAGLTVAQMAKVTSVSGHTLRYWESAGLIEGIARSEPNQRRYHACDVEWIRE